MVGVVVAVVVVVILVAATAVQLHKVAVVILPYNNWTQIDPCVKFQDLSLIHLLPPLLTLQCLLKFYHYYHKSFKYEYVISIHECFPVGRAVTGKSQSRSLH